MAGTRVSDAEEDKHLCDENARLKKLVAELRRDEERLQSATRIAEKISRSAMASS
jgi:hypothetical protein